MGKSWGWALASLCVAGCFLGGNAANDESTRNASRDAGADRAFGFPGDEDVAMIDVVESQPPETLPPTFGATVTATAPPPAISGGTLLVTNDGRYAIAADPDRDHVYGVDLASGSVAFDTALLAGDEPGRVAEDGSGRVHVALRGGGALVTMNESTGAVLARRNVCPAPRGVTWDASTDLVWVACATGELVAFPSSGGAASTRLVVERDLRDVFVSNGAISVTSFRSALILRLASDASITRRDAMPMPVISTMTPHVAWRAVSAPSNRIVVVHQVETTQSLSTLSTGGYGGGCGGGPPPPDSPTQTDGGAEPAPTCSKDAGNNFNAVPCPEQPGAVASAITIVASDGSIVTDRLFPGTLPVDVAVSRDGEHVAAVAAGDGFAAKLGSVSTFSNCGDLDAPATVIGNAETPIAVAYDATGRLLVQTREPAKLWIDGAPIVLSTSSRNDTGHDIFHAQAGMMIACASCHPEGGDDGHVWMLDGKVRRTPSLRGTIAGTAPYHWPGDEPTFNGLVDDVYTHRMAGALLATDQKSALGAWVESIPAPPSPSWIDSNAAARGEAIFNDASIGCSSCHSGAKFTNNTTVDVGTGGAFQVPPLVGVGWRTPLLHDGCAATIADRFGVCATQGHGQIGTLSPANISDLSTYLETL